MQGCNTSYSVLMIKKHTGTRAGLPPRYSNNDLLVKLQVELLRRFYVINVPAVVISIL